MSQISDNLVWVNDGTGRFDSTGLSMGEEGIAISLGDVDGDGDCDALIGKIEGYGGNRLYVCSIPRETLRRPSRRVAPLPMD